MSSRPRFSIPVSGVVLAVILAGCARRDPFRSFLGSYRNYTEIKGTIKDGRYTSPQANFSCLVPPLARPGAVIHDESRKLKEGNVVGKAGFEDDLGTFLRVDWFEVPGDMRARPDRVLLERVADSLFAAYRQGIPNSEIEVHKYSGETNNQSLFLMARLPSGSTMTVNGRRQDCSRASLVFRRGNWAYALSTQDRPLLPKTTTVEQREAELRSKLEEFLASFEFK